MMQENRSLEVTYNYKYLTSNKTIIVYLDINITLKIIQIFFFIKKMYFMYTNVYSNSLLIYYFISIFLIKSFLTKIPNKSFIQKKI